MKEYLIELIDRYGGFVVGGLIGAVVHRMREKMSIRRFLSVLGISAFVGLCVGILMRSYLEVSQEIIFVACSVSGVFSKDLLDEIQEIIRNISEFVKQKMGVRDEK